MDDCGLEVKGSLYCTKKHLDQLFVQVNAGDGKEAYNLKLSLNRQEFLQVRRTLSSSRTP